MHGYANEAGLIDANEPIPVRMLSTFNQHLPMILSDNYYSQRKPTSLLDPGMDDVPYFCAAEHEMCAIY